MFLVRREEIYDTQATSVLSEHFVRFDVNPDKIQVGSEEKHVGIGKPACTMHATRGTTGQLISSLA
jgi:hypothetical protein